jgi:hypothetical protein
MLLIDFEQAFVVHNIYRESERDLFKLSLRILALPPIMAGTLLSAGLVSSTTQLAVILQLPIIWLALIAAGLINSIAVRSSVTTDRVQTEAKHQVNRLRALYLHTLADQFPPGWQPVWGSTNAHLDTRLKFKAAVFSPLILGSMNAVYVAYGTDRLLAYQAGVSWHLALSVPMGLVYFFIQLETTWNIIREFHKRTRPGGHHGRRQSMAVPTRKG